MDTKAPTPQILLPGQHHMDGPNIPHQPTGISAQSHDQTHQPDPTHIVSPQSTGTKNLTSQPTLTTTHQQEPIEMASPQPPEYANMAQQEKAYLPPNGNAQHSNGAPPSAAQGGPAKNIYTYATPLPSLQGVPAPVDCPFCGQRELTRTVHVSGGTTHLSALLLCCCFCLGCIPYIGNWLKDCEHNCGSCGQLLAVWHKSGRTEVMAHPTRSTV